MLEKDLRSPSSSIKAWLDKLSSNASSKVSNSGPSENFFASGSSFPASLAHSYSLPAPPLSHVPLKESVAVHSNVPPSLKQPDMTPFDSLRLQSGSITADDLCDVYSTDVSSMAAARTLDSVMAAGIAPPDPDTVKRVADQMFFNKLHNKFKGGCGRNHISLQGL